MAGSNGERFFLSSDINLPVTLRVESLEGDLQRYTEATLKNATDFALAEHSPVPDLFVECSLYIDGVLFGLPTKTRLAPIEKPYKWNEMITLSAKYRDLTATTQLTFTVWDVSYPRQEVAVGGASFRIFSKKKELKTGKQKLRLWRGRIADGAVVSSTPGKVPKHERGELERLDKALNKYERGQIERIDWLDNLTFKAIDRIKEEESKRIGQKNLHLVVELLSFMHPVAFQVCCDDLVLQSPRHQLVVIPDPEVGRQNPCENKQIKLARHVTRGVIDHELKPSITDRKEIARILQYPPTRNLNGEERQTLWKFRFSLTGEKRALTKFLKCVDWSDATEAKQALELMHKWTTIDIADALELLSHAFESEEVRGHAIDVLERTGDEELQSYLFQLVQALRFERSDKSRLANFLVQRAVHNTELANFLRWYLNVELADVVYAKRFWLVLEHFNESVAPPMAALLHHQSELLAKLCTIARDVKNVRGNLQKKIDRLREMLQGIMNELTSFEALPFPLDPTIMLIGILPAESSVFKSNLSPLRLTFRTVEGGKCRVIFKKGDDLRQDQLVIQLITLMDKLLKSENLDLQLTPYRVLSTSHEEGMVEFIHSTPLAQVLAENKTIIQFFKQFHPDEEGPFGISSPCLETFVKSCAGYCVITYILGVGDRHLDNLLLQQDGRLFHVDFGFILGRDSKPFPPPMKLCKEMVEAMGGMDSQHYSKFKMYCCEAYNILRKSSNLILNLLFLMSGANLPDISSDPEKGVLKLQEKFRLDLDDEEAVQFFQTLINDSVSALFPQMVETIHRWAQYWR
ncbi:hypothetical protein SELMODRAFT_97360 [Selaginella moellendorffii]|uniref:phosphatidylinositol 3-kinase n=1 Tax=Selaginella moellendorffii TaxID=88036 RepID=D8RMQ9_SELML|nr:hypothetical protein SELMODRAFT_97360 [Selaginella moellendorffii]